MMGDKAELRQRQEDELEVIKAIYVGDVESEVRKRPSKDPIRYTVRLLPQRGGSSWGGAKHGSKVPTFLIIAVTIPLKYPNEPPELKVKDSKGLSSQELTELHGQLKEMAKENLGEEMMYQLLQHAEIYLHSHQKLAVGSFHDEMIMRKKQQEEQIMQKQIDLKEKERLAIKEEILRKQKEEREEIRKLKERKVQLNSTSGPADEHSPSSSPHASPIKGDGFPSSMRVRTNSKRHSTGKRRKSTNSEGSDSSISDSSEMTIIEFVNAKISHLFYRGKVLGKNERGATIYAGMSRNGELVAITEWKFTTKLDKKGKEVKQIGAAGEDGNEMTLESVMKLIGNYETEMNHLQKLDHRNIVYYFGLKAFSAADEPGTVTVYLAEEFVPGTTLRSYLQGTLSVDIPLIRHCAMGILEGLQYLHQNDVVHRFLRDSSIFLDSCGTIKITDYGLERKIYELHQTFHGYPEFQDPFPPSIGRGGKKGDIYRLGVILLSLINHSYVQNPTEISTSLPAELQDFLRKCLTPIEHSRWTATELLKHEFLKLPLNVELHLKLPYAKKTDKMAREEEEDTDEGSDGLPQYMPHLFKGHSRVQSEFEILKFLGKGGFGDVLKVKNKLDGRMYALKRIKLNPRNKQLNRKITREVKLLSQLNHENVVRYFNSWIETVIESDDERSTTTDSYTTEGTKTDATKDKTSPRSKSIHFLKNQNSLGFLDNIEELARSVRETSDWGDSKSNIQQLSDDDSEESSDDDDLFGTSFRRITMEDSDEIVFEDSNSRTSISSGTNDKDTDTAEDSQKLSTNASLSLTSFLHESQYLYIQMEFCEKSTLRNAIDNNLCEDLDRAWRLFREIVEGLVHIHQQGMIHRDLKPVNIFLDSYDHVKIGDFGLATSSIISKRHDETMSIQPMDMDVDADRSVDFPDESRTGQVGTALYVAPELIATGQKASYNQKVDIYSLGIMFFEMFYHPPGTGMERVRVIMGLRQNVVTFPKDFDETLFPQVTHITRWLLNHDHTKRPTSLELLQSDYLPPPHLEEAELRDIFQRTLRSSKTKAYKYLVASCFQQEISSVEDATYDMDEKKPIQAIASSTSAAGGLSRSLFFVQKVKSVIYHVFERHGATELQTPLLMPKSSLYEENDTCVNLMCHGGGIVSVPHDLRVPFARYIGRHGIAHFKRFSIDKVFRERKVYGWHPRELIECAYDIVDTSQGRLLADAEVVSVVCEILQELPWLSNRSCTIRLGHTKLLQGVLLHHGVDEKHHDKVRRILSEMKNERDSKQQVQTHFCSLGLSDHFITTLLQLIEVEGSFGKISSMLKGIMKRKGEAASCIKEALHELEILINNLESFGMKCNITVAPTMTFCTKIYSGLLFQVMCDLKRRKNKMMVDVIAAGGRYDELIREYRTSLCIEQDSSAPTKDETPCGVGISISLDKLIAGFELQDDDNVRKLWGQRGSVDVLVCAPGHHPMTKEKIEMLKKLWTKGVHAAVIDGSPTLAYAEEVFKEMGAMFLIILKEDEYYNHVRVRMWENGRFDEKKLPKSEAIELITRSLTVIPADGIPSSTGISIKSEISSTKAVGTVGTDATYQTTHGHVCSTHVHNHNANTPLPPYNIMILSQDREKIALVSMKNTRKYYESQIMRTITDALAKFGRHQTIDILGLEMNSSVINHLASSLSLHDKEDYNKTVIDVLEKIPGMRKYLKAACDEICNLVYEKKTSVVILYGLLDNSYRVLL